MIREDASEPAPPLLLTPRGEGELGELFEGIVREQAARIEPDEILEGPGGTARIRGQLAHRGVVGRALLRRNPGLAATESSATRLDERERQQKNEPRMRADPDRHTPLTSARADRPESTANRPIRAPSRRLDR